MNVDRGIDEPLFINRRVSLGEMWGILFIGASPCGLGKNHYFWKGTPPLVDQYGFNTTRKLSCDGGKSVSRGFLPLGGNAKMGTARSRACFFSPPFCFLSPVRATSERNPFVRTHLGSQSS